MEGASSTPPGEQRFGYDPLLFVPEYGQVMAELGPEVKNRISHRARAVATAKRHRRQLAVASERGRASTSSWRVPLSRVK